MELELSSNKTKNRLDVGIFTIIRYLFPEVMTMMMMMMMTIKMFSVRTKRTEAAMVTEGEMVELVVAKVVEWAVELVVAKVVEWAVELVVAKVVEWAVELVVAKVVQQNAGFKCQWDISKCISFLLFFLFLFFFCLSVSFFGPFSFFKKNFLVPFQRLQTTGNRPRAEKDGSCPRMKRIVSLITYLFFHVVFFGIRGEKKSDICSQFGDRVESMFILNLY